VIAVVVLAAALALAFATGQLPLRTSSAARRVPAPAPKRVDTAAARAPDTLPALVPANPADSALASAYAIEVAKFNTEDGARQARDRAPGLPGATAFPVTLGNDRGARWYRVMGGGWTTRIEADSALGVMRRTRVVDSTASVVRAPFALLLAEGVARDSVAARTARYAAAGVPAYALRQDDGSLSLYAGAFESPDQAVPIAQAVMAMGQTPTLVYRTGRAF
jgi:hypothetical protein